jgi:hypothetical protein
MNESFGRHPEQSEGAKTRLWLLRFAQDDNRVGIGLCN